MLGSILRRALPHGVRGPVLDIGARPATNAVLLGALATDLISLDASPAAVAWCARDGYGTPVRADALQLPFADGSIGFAAALDVLEHLDHDADVLAEIRRVLRSDGAALVVVPAFQALWGWQDQVSGHKRRYHPRVIAGSMRHAGFVPFKETCLNSVLAGPILPARRVLRLSRRRARSENTLTPRWLDPILYALVAAEAPVAARLRLPGGTSAVVLARPR